MRSPRNLYVNEKWHGFSEKVKSRDNYKCLQCDREEPEVVLQVHHEKYIKGQAPWDYSLSDCRTLCKGCHARSHGLIEPDRGWTLISINDLEGLDGICERNGCGNEIRYEHSTYHPSWGHMVVGSTCIEHLKQEDRLISSSTLKHYKNISEFVHSGEWGEGYTKKNKKYLTRKYKHHYIRIYGEKNRFAYQLLLKEKGVRWYDYQDIMEVPNRGLPEIKEIAYIVLKGTISESEEEKSTLRDIYRGIVRKTHNN